MSKDFTEVAFNLIEFKTELQQFCKLLNSKVSLGEREIQAFFKTSMNLTAYIGTTFGTIGVARQVAYEFEIFGDYSADIVFGNREKQFCFVELESGNTDSVLEDDLYRELKEGYERYSAAFKAETNADNVGIAKPPASA